MDFIDIKLWNQKIEKAFEEAKLKLPSYEGELKTILSVLTSDLSTEEKIILEKRATQLKNIIDDLLTDTSFGFYLLEVQEFLDQYDKMEHKTNKNISFMKKDRVIKSEDLNLSRLFVELIQKYNDILHLDIPKISVIKKPLICECGNTRDLETVDGRIIYCQKCGIQLREKISNDAPTFKDIERVNSTNKYKYSRMIHIQNCIKQFQGKQKVKIPLELIRDVNDQLQMTKSVKINPQHIRSALQSTGWSDHYENCVLIWSMITQKSCPDISHLESEILKDFELVEREYNILMSSPDEERTSFMSYPYVLFCLLRRRGFKCNRNFFNMVKFDRMDWLDNIMEKIFDRLEWGKFESVGE
jgi:hypothetical protein